MLLTMASSRDPRFLDTAYLVALIDTRDQWHLAAVHWAQRIADSGQPLVTTEFVLIEFADALATVRFRPMQLRP